MNPKNDPNSELTLSAGPELGRHNFRGRHRRNFVVLCLLFYAVVAILFTFVEVTTAQAACGVRPNCMPAPVPQPSPTPYFKGGNPFLAPVIVGRPEPSVAGLPVPSTSTSAPATLPPTDTTP